MEFLGRRPVYRDKQNFQAGEAMGATMNLVEKVLGKSHGKNSSHRMSHWKIMEWTLHSTGNPIWEVVEKCDVSYEKETKCLHGKPDVENRAFHVGIPAGSVIERFSGSPTEFFHGVHSWENSL